MARGPAIQRVIVVTGASRGIGAATAQWLGGYGARVVAVGRDAAALAGVAEHIRRGGGVATTIAGDLITRNFPEQLASAVLGEFGRIDAVVNNAGIVGEVSPIAHTSAGMWRQVYETNVFAPVACITAALPALRAAGGRVVNVSSVVATVPAEAIGAYASSKAAISHITRTLSAEEPDITALAYQPGPTGTDLMAAIVAAAPRAMSPATARRYRRLAETGLVDLATTSRRLALLTLFAPRSWSGRILDYSDQEIDDLEK